MDVSVAIFLLITVTATLLLSRQWAVFPLLLTTFYMPTGPGLEIGPFHVTALRWLILAGFIRILIRGEYKRYTAKGIDGWMAAWSLWALLNSFLHGDIAATLVNHLGTCYTSMGIYFYLRILCQSSHDVIRIARMMAVLAVPVAVEMLLEQMTGNNLFHYLGGVPEMVEIREGRIRSQGAFSHPILAGTVGALLIPLMIGLWRHDRMKAGIGLLAAAGILLASVSSGPILSGFAALMGLGLWKFRHLIRVLAGVAIVAYIGLNILMQAPAYYVISYIDLVGGSTSWHRAALIDAAWRHLDEWWLAGTDYTRHWLPYGVPWSQNHVDFTNHLIRMGIDGGILQIIIFIVILKQAFTRVGEDIRRNHERRFLVWTLGVMLLTHVVSFMSISYFDQSIVLLYFTLAAILAFRQQTGDRPESSTSPALAYYRHVTPAKSSCTESTGVLKGCPASSLTSLGTR